MRGGGPWKSSERKGLLRLLLPDSCALLNVGVLFCHWVSDSYVQWHLNQQRNCHHFHFCDVVPAYPPTETGARDFLCSS